MVVPAVSSGLRSQFVDAFFILGHACRDVRVVFPCRHLVVAAASPADASFGGVGQLAMLACFFQRRCVRVVPDGLGPKLSILP